MPIRSKEFYYRTTVRWTAGKRGEITCEDPAKPTMEVATPPEFKGEPGYWTPEDLFVASLNACLMTTFFAVAAREELEYLAYESSAEGLLARAEGRPMAFTRVTLRPFITLPADGDPDLARVVLEMAEQGCMISNSVRCQVLLEPQFIVRA